MSNRSNYGKSSMSPKARQNMKREAEKNEKKFKSTCDYDSISDLMNNKKSEKGC